MTKRSLPHRAYAVAAGAVWFAAVYVGLLRLDYDWYAAMGISALVSIGATVLAALILDDMAGR